MKHTPGPWETGKPYEHCKNSWFSVVFSPAKTDAFHSPRAAEALGVTKKEAVANANLIAAAPDLLEALKYIRSRLIDPENPNSQQWICSDSLHPDNDDKSVVDYIQEAIKKAEGRD